MTTQSPSPVGQYQLLTRHERQRCEYISGQIQGAVREDTALTPEQQQALLTATDARIRQMALERQFFQGIPVKVAIGGNQFHITPPVPLAKAAVRGILMGAAGMGGAALAAAYPAVVGTSVAAVTTGHCIKKQIDSGRNPLGLGTLVKKAEEKCPVAKDCCSSIYS